MSTRRALGLSTLFVAGILMTMAVIEAVTASAGTGGVQKTLDWNEKSAGSRILKTVCGVLVILGGLYLIYTSH